MEERIELLEQAIAELQLKIAQFDAIAFTEEVRYELAVWKQSTEDKIQSLEVQLLHSIQQIGSLDALVKKAEELLKKLEGIDLQALDPEKIKQLVLTALDGWRAETDGQLDSLDARVTKLEEAIKEISPEKILDQVLITINAWKAQMEADLAENKTRLDKLSIDFETLKTHFDTALAALTAQIEELKEKDKTHDGHFLTLDTNLAALAKRIEEIALIQVDPEIIRQEVEKLIAEWKAEVEQRLTDLEGLQPAIDALKKRLDELPPIISVDEIKQLIATELAGLKSDLDAEISDRKEKDNTMLGDLDSLNVRLTALEIKVDTITGGGGLNEAQVKALIIAELGIFQNSIDQKISDLHTSLLLKIEQVKNALSADLGGLNTRLLLVEDQLKLGGNVDITQIIVLVIKELEAWQQQIVQRVADLEAHQVADRQDIDQLLQDLSDLTVKVGALVILTQQEVTDLINVNLAVWISKIESIEQLILVLETNSTAYEQDIASLKAGLEALAQIFAGPLPANWEAQVQQIIEALLFAIKADLIQLQLEKTTLEEALALLQTTVEGMQTDLTALAETVANLPVPLTEAEINALIGIQIGLLQTDLEAQLGLLQTDLEAKIAALALRISALETAQANILLVIEEIKASIAAQKIKIDLLQQLIIEVKTTVENLPSIPTAEEIVEQVKIIISTWKQEIQIEIQKLKACCEEGTGKIADLEQEVAEIKKVLQQSDAGAVGIRLARLCLTGWGIVGGLEIKSDDACAIHLSKGSGITPRGVLTHACEPLYFTHYRKFEKPDDDPMFKKYELWELLVWETLNIGPGDPIPDDIFPLTPQTGTAPLHIADKAVILLPGEQRNYYLLIRIGDLVALCGKTAALQHCMSTPDFDPDMGFSETFSPLDAQPTDDHLYLAFNPVILLPEIPLFRFGFRPPDECDPEELDDPNFPTICSLDQMYETWLPIIQDAFKQVDRWVKAIMEQYHELLFPQLDKGGFANKLDLLLEKWTAFTKYNKNAQPNKTSKFYAQHFYDWARDLIAGYHELRSELQILMAELCLCRPDLLLEQRPWLMLGPAVRPVQDGLAAPLRDAFHQSPIFNGNAIRLETCRLYYHRLFEMCEGFYLPGYQDDQTLPCWCKSDDDWEPDFSRLRITPGKGYIYPLSCQSLPYYYPLAPNMESLHFYWEYRRSKFRQVNKHLSYHASDADDSYSHRPEVIRPLYYSLDPYDFYRIEGATGKSRVQLSKDLDAPVLDAIRFMIQKYNLDFDVVEYDIACNECKFLTQKYGYKDPLGTLSVAATSFRQDMLGAEHLAGVPKGGTYILITSTMVLDDVSQKVVVADFAVPYRCCPEKPKICSLGVVAKVMGPCKDGNVPVKIVVTPSNPKNNRFKLFIDGKQEGADYLYKVGGPTTIDILMLADNKEHTIKAIDRDNECCGETRIKLPSCDCKLTVQVTAATVCVRGAIHVEVIVTSLNAKSAGFHIQLDGKDYPFGAPVSYVYDADGITTIPMDLPGDGKEHTLVVKDGMDVKCEGKATFKIPDCKPMLSVSAVPGNTCTPSGLTTVEVLVAVKNPPEGQFKVLFGGKSLPGVGPITYHPGGANTFSISAPGDGELHTIEIKDRKDESLKAQTEVRVHLCQEDVNVLNPSHKSPKKPR